MLIRGRGRVLRPVAVAGRAVVRPVRVPPVGVAAVARHVLGVVPSSCVLPVGTEPPKRAQGESYQYMPRTFDGANGPRAMIFPHAFRYKNESVGGGRKVQNVPRALRLALALALSEA